MTGILLLALALIVYGSLYPWQFHFNKHLDPFSILLHAWPSHFDRFVLRDAVINVALYAPLGAAAVLVGARRYGRALGLLLTVVMGAALSASIEMLQVYDFQRYTSMLDVSCNTAGTLLGAVVGLQFRRQFEGYTSAAKLHRRTVAAMLVALWFTYQLYPFFPVLSRTRLRTGLSSLLALQGFSPAEIWIVAAGWLAAALALEALLSRLPALWLLAVMASVPVRFFIPGRAPGISDVLGAGLAFLLWAFLKESARSRAAFWMALSAIGVSELQPFRFERVPRKFHWIPFASSLAAARQPALIELAGKASYYAAAIWLWHARGSTYRRAGIALGAALLVLEWIQRYLPGRTPETTDAILALFLALVVSLLEKSQARKKSGRTH